MLLLGSPLALVERFYARLFAAHPFLRPLFPLRMDDQQAKLAGVIRLAVANLRAPEALAPTLADLGRLHVGYGVLPGHYRIVVDTLLASLGDRLGEQLDARARAAWSRALEFLVAAMQPAAACPVEQVELTH
jgi:hemoglobin-like flavoprotein